jgi:hypothetical protein
VHTAAVETNADKTSTVHDDYPTIEQLVGNTPLVRLQRLPGRTSNVILCKLEGNNPAGACTACSSSQGVQPVKCQAMSQAPQLGARCAA